MGTFVIALAHFVSEMLVFKTAAPTAGAISPLVVASGSLIAMALQLRSYEH